MSERQHSELSCPTTVLVLVVHGGSVLDPGLEASVRKSDVTEHFTINYMNGQNTAFTKLFTINGQRNTKHFTKRNTKHFTINYINEILFLQY